MQTNNKLKLDEVKKETGLRPTWENIAKHSVLTKAKIQIAQHHAGNVVIVGAKGTGKSIIPMIKLIVKFEEDKYFNAFGFRKYQEQATKQMSDLFINAVTMMELRGFKMSKPYDLKTNSKAVFRMNNKTKMSKNQAFKFGNLENASGSTDGGAPANGGYYGMIVIDEPVIEADAGHPEKIPSKAEWDKKLSIIEDNMSRYNSNLEDILGKELETQLWSTMNNWGDHPNIVKIDKYLPEDEFIQWVFGMPLDDILGNEELINKLFDNKKFIARLQQNSTLSRYIKAEDTLYVRMTKFANPTNFKPKVLSKLMRQIKEALIDGEMQQLTILLGTKSVPEIDTEMLAYNIPDFNNDRTLKSFLDDGYEITKVAYSWDVDTSRVFTMTPGIGLTKTTKELDPFAGKIISKKDQIVYIDKQFEFRANGTGELGEKNIMYAESIIHYTDKHWQSMKEFNKSTKPIISIDDKRDWYSMIIKDKKKDYFGVIKRFEQHGVFDIQNRQDLLAIGLENKRIYINPENIELVNDIKVCQKADIKSPKRKTSGNTNYLDRIDSMENAMIPFAHILRKRK